MQPLLQQQTSQHDLLNSLVMPHTLAPSDVHVLLVDDERLSRMVVGNVLRKCNYRGAALSCTPQGALAWLSGPDWLHRHCFSLSLTTSRVLCPLT